MLGVEIPIVSAPMGWIARSQFAAIRGEVRRMREFTSRSTPERRSARSELDDGVG